MSDFNSSNYLA